MAEEFSVRVSGLNEAIAMLERTGKNSKLAIARGLAAAAVPVVAALGARTPSRSELFNPETFSTLAGTAEKGSLKASLRTDIALSSDGKGGVASVNFGKQGYVANLLDGGHRIVGHKPNLKDTGKAVPASAFMRIAGAESADAAIEAFTDGFSAEIVGTTEFADIGEAA